MEIKLISDIEISVNTYGWIKFEEFFAQAFRFIKDHEGQLEDSYELLDGYIINAKDTPSIEFGYFILSDGNFLSSRIAKIGFKISKTEGRREIIIYGVDFSEADFIMSIHPPYSV